MARFLSSATNLFAGAAFIVVAIACIEFSERVAPAIGQGAQALALLIAGRAPR